MKSYTKIYLSFFGYSIADFIPCEVCQKKAVDIHHIEARSIARALLNAIENLMALCRACHIKYGDKKEHKQFLIDTHKKAMQNGQQ